MTSMTQEELNEVIRKHDLWLKKEFGPGSGCVKGEEKAILSFKDLHGLNFQGADLRYVDLHRSILSNSTLTQAVLWGADLSYADLNGIYMNDADLAEANLECSYCHGSDFKSSIFNQANLSSADFSNSNFHSASLQGAILNKANFSYADLRCVSLNNVELYGANLYKANLDGADISYSSFPLWCGGLNVRIDENIAQQLAYHFCSMECNSPEFIKLRNLMVDFANKFKYVNHGCPMLQEIPLPTEK